jgi:hypothetical protein
MHGGSPLYSDQSAFLRRNNRSPFQAGKDQEPHTPRDGSGSWSHSDDDPGKDACAEAGAYLLIARLQQEDIGPEERDEIERLLEKIETALDLLDKAGPSGR